MHRKTLKEFARELGVSLPTVWRWSTKGVRGKRLETIVIGGRRWVLQSSIDAFLAQPAMPDKAYAQTLQSLSEAQAAQHISQRLDELLE